MRHIQAGMFCVAFLLVFSFGLHVVEHSHEHPHHTERHNEHQSQSEKASTLSTYLHTSDRKIFLALPPPSLGYDMFLSEVMPLVARSAPQGAYCKPGSWIEYLRECFSDGILNTKVYRT